MILTLDASLLINKGTNRACYVHPQIKERCIKITISSNDKETKREVKYYEKLQKRGVSWEMLSKYYGMVATNLGAGECVELVRDYDGEISKELDKYLNDEKLLQEVKNLTQHLCALKEYLYAQKIYVKDLNSVNVLYQKLSHKEARLVVIDGIAHSDYNPFTPYIKSILLKKMDKSWNKFALSIKQKEAFKKSLLDKNF